MLAPERLKIDGKEFIREDLVIGKNSPSKIKVKTKFDHDVKKTLIRDHKLAKAIEEEIRKEAKIPKEVWAPIAKKLEGKGNAQKKLKKILHGGETEPLIEFAKKHDIDYDSLRRLMTMVNPKMHASETLKGAMAKAVRALKDAGIVKPINVDEKQLWSAWLSAIDSEAQ